MLRRASVMTGHLTGLQARVKNIASNAIFTHCLAHRLNLALQHGCNMNSKCRIFFANLTDMSAYFHNSTHALMLLIRVYSRSLKTDKN